MQTEPRSYRRRRETRRAAIALALTGALILPASSPVARAASGGDPELGHEARVPDYDVNLASGGAVRPSAARYDALATLSADLGAESLTARWDKATGSLDVAMDFASAPSAAEPEAAARAFVEQHAAVFGIGDMASLRLERSTAALGGHLLYFRQLHEGLPVAGGGVGVVMDGEKRVRMLSGPYFAGLEVATNPSLDGAAAVAAAQADLAAYAVEWPAGAEQYLNPGYDALAAELGVLATPHPQLNVFPAPSGARLAWSFHLFSRNPFGMFAYQVDAQTGEVLSRANQVRYQQEPEVLPFTADVYPASPVLADPDTGELAKDANGEPEGLLRVQLRKFNPGMNATAVEGTMSGTHALIRNVLATKLPFAQAAAGTFHFRTDDPPLEAQPDEQDDLAEPAEHIDMANNFFFVTYLLEYVDHLHRAGDRLHSAFGEGHFPDDYVNSDRPLVGLVHFPSDAGLVGLSGPVDTTSPDTIVRSILGMDNAFSLSATQTVAGQPIVVNPTAYGHGYLFNDLAKDGPVVYHEGMHSISTPIAGLRAAPEGGALNEGQADLWAYSITEDKVLGNYVVNGHRLRQLVRDGGGDPDLRQWIRHADSGLTYSRLGTRSGNQFQVHRDGEIYAATMIDIRELLLLYQQGGPWKRPNLFTGEVTVATPLGKETWERLLLGAIYILGTLEPDTFVRARDAMIQADQFLYPSNPLDPTAPGLHRALIEQVFAAHEIGANAAAPAGGRQTISTQVSPFAAQQASLAAPSNVAAAPASPKSVRVSWDTVPGAVAYEVLKRAVGREDERQNPPVVGREYFDGDASTDGYLHVDYVAASQTSYVDEGFIEGGFVRRGLPNPVEWEYVVRTLSVNPNNQLGVSGNSAAASAPTAILDVTGDVSTAFSNISFAGGRTEFDLSLSNLGAGAFDGTIYVPIGFEIVSISNPTVSAANADNAGSGHSGDSAIWYMRPTLVTGATSNPRRLVLDNPNTQFFSFDARVTARVQVDPSQATRYEPEPPPDLSGFEEQQVTDVYTGIVPAMDLGTQLVGGVTYVDVPFVARDGAIAVVGNMTSQLGLDLDLYILDDQGNELSASESASANEVVNAAIQAGRTYRYRVVGWAGAAQDFRIESTQTLLVPKSNGGTSPLVGDPLTQLLRFSVNPLTGTVSVATVQ